MSLRGAKPLSGALYNNRLNAVASPDNAHLSAIGTQSVGDELAGLVGNGGGIAHPVFSGGPANVVAVAPAQVLAHPIDLPVGPRQILPPPGDEPIVDPTPNPPPTDPNAGQVNPNPLPKLVPVTPVTDPTTDPITQPTPTPVGTTPPTTTPTGTTDPVLSYLQSLDSSGAGGGGVGTSIPSPVVYPGTTSNSNQGLIVGGIIASIIGGAVWYFVEHHKKKQEGK